MEILKNDYSLLSHFSNIKSVLLMAAGDCIHQFAANLFSKVSKIFLLSAFPSIFSSSFLYVHVIFLISFLFFIAPSLSPNSRPNVSK